MCTKHLFYVKYNNGTKFAQSRDIALQRFLRHSLQCFILPWPVCSTPALSSVIISFNSLSQLGWCYGNASKRNWTLKKWKPPQNEFFGLFPLFLGPFPVFRKSFKFWVWDSFFFIKLAIMSENLSNLSDKHWILMLILMPI